MMSELPTAPWENIAVDYHGPLASGDYLLVVIDEYSRFPFVEISKSTSAKSTIPKLDKIFSITGIPSVLKSDNGAPFNSEEFRKFVGHLGISTRHITPEYPQANGLVENFNKMLDKVLSTSFVENRSWKQEMYKFLHIYRATPHLSTGQSPASLLFQRRCFRTRLPELPIFPDDAQVREEDRKNKLITKQYADDKRGVRECRLKEGDVVIVRRRRIRKGTPHYDPKPYEITKKKGNMIVARRDDKEIVRNSSCFKKIDMPASFNYDIDNQVELVPESDREETHDNPVNIQHDEEQLPEEAPVIRRSGRLRQAPEHLKDYVVTS